MVQVTGREGEIVNGIELLTDADIVENRRLNKNNASTFVLTLKKVLKICSNMFMH